MTSEFRIFMEVIKHLWKLNDQEMRALALESGVGLSTLHNWKYGSTLRPRIDTLTKVTTTMGYEITLVRRRSSRKEVA